ncbi:hypothetical protein F5Y12DRAFT_748963 [Xylaria sp. FL1777]|nr:hypothetical protein F5Y12DRAFT_748963 [Xylaria sp. FL1777]
MCPFQMFTSLTGFLICFWRVTSWPKQRSISRIAIFTSLPHILALFCLAIVNMYTSHYAQGCPSYHSG